MISLILFCLFKMNVGWQQIKFFFILYIFQNINQWKINIYLYEIIWVNLNFYDNTLLNYQIKN
jgi:hypothetical protein